MPLTSRGKKIMKSMKEKYGKKKGEQVFYATKNKGKLKGVEKAYLGKAVRQPTETKKEFEMRHAYHKPFMKKPKGFRGGGADFGAPERAASRAKAGYGSTAGPDRSKVSAAQEKSHQQAVKSAQAYNKQKTTTTDTTKKPPTLFQAVKGPTPFMGFNFLKNVIFDPMTKYSREQKAKGETLITQKAVTLPATREYYRTKEKPLDVMSKEGKQYMKDAGLLSDTKVTPPSNSGQDKMCPDGTMPPCVKPSVTKMPTPTSSTGSSSSSNFLKDFIFYPLKSGGVSSGPPPKKGPNPQVPPVKLSRGGGAAIRGTKFKGIF